MALQVACLVRNLRSNRIDICSRANKFQSKPMVCSSSIIAKQNRRPIVLGDKNVDRTVVIEISQRQAASRKLLGKHGTTFGTDILQPASSIAEKKQRLFIRYIFKLLANHQIGMSVGEQQIEVSIIVVIEELRTPTAEEPGGRRDSGWICHIVKPSIPGILVQRK